MVIFLFESGSTPSDPHRLLNSHFGNWVNNARKSVKLFYFFSSPLSFLFLCSPFLVLVPRFGSPSWFLVLVHWFCSLSWFPSPSWFPVFSPCLGAPSWFPVLATFLFLVSCLGFPHWLPFLVHCLGYPSWLRALVSCNCCRLAPTGVKPQTHICPSG